MRLMKRERGSLVALPVQQCGIRPTDKLLSVSETAVDTVMFIVEKERKELQKQLSDEQDCPETCFIEQAIGLLDERYNVLSSRVAHNPAQKECIEAEQDVEKTVPQFIPNVTYQSAFDNEYVTSTNSACSPELSFSPPEEDLQTGDESLESKERQRYESVSSEGLGSDDGNTAITAEDLEITSLPTSEQPGSSPIIEMESGSMTDELRRRLRYLQHLPVTYQLELRRRRRQRRAHDERRREKKITEEENRRWGRYPTPHIRIESHRHFPQCGTDVDPTVLVQFIC
ncbi:hypothetical protein C0J52_08428 [Blattella germanica]|nr:hypothetical protein C0J52_08428 [Blattella germanica]